MRYAQIRSLDVSNGTNIGVALFTQGCDRMCKNCFNPETWDFNGGKEWTSKIKENFLELIDRPYIKRVSILGGEPLADENLDSVLDLVTEINKRYNIPQDIVFNNDNNHNILNENSDEIRLSCPNKSIWLYTGYKLEDIGFCKAMNIFFKGQNSFEKSINKEYCNIIRQQIIAQCDVLVDGRYIDTQRDIALKWRGSSNQRVINIQESFKQGKVMLYCD